MNDLLKTNLHIFNKYDSLLEHIIKNGISSYFTKPLKGEFNGMKLEECTLNNIIYYYCQDSNCDDPQEYFIILYTT